MKLAILFVGFVSLLRILVEHAGTLNEVSLFEDDEEE